MLLAVRISSYGCTWKVWRALKKLELHEAITHLSCSPNFPRASITRYTHAKHEQILNTCIIKFLNTLLFTLRKENLDEEENIILGAPAGSCSSKAVV